MIDSKWPLNASEEGQLWDTTFKKCCCNMVFKQREVIIGTGELRIGEGFVQFGFSCMLDFLPDTSTSTDLSAR